MAAKNDETRQKVRMTLKDVTAIARKVQKFLRGRSPVSPIKLLLRSSDLNPGETEIVQEWHAEIERRLLEARLLNPSKPGVLRHPNAPPRGNLQH